MEGGEKGLNILCRQLHVAVGFYLVGHDFGNQLVEGEAQRNREMGLPHNALA